MNIKNRLDKLETQHPTDDEPLYCAVVGAHFGKLDAPLDWINYGGGIVCREPGETEAEFMERADKTKPPTDRKFNIASGGYFFDEAAFRKHFKDRGIEIDEAFVEKYRALYRSSDGR